MGRGQRAPTKLEKFQPVYFKMIRWVMEKGSFTVSFETNLIAVSERYRVYELFRSIQAYSDDEEMKERVKSFRVTWNKGGNWITVYDANVNRGVTGFEGAFDKLEKMAKEFPDADQAYEPPNDEIVWGD